MVAASRSLPCGESSSSRSVGERRAGFRKGTGAVLEVTNALRETLAHGCLLPASRLADAPVSGSVHLPIASREVGERGPVRAA